MCTKPADRHQGEPHGRDRAEPGGDPSRAVALHREEADHDHEAERQHVGLEGGRHEFEPLDGRKDGDGRRDDGVAIEQRGPDHAEQGDHEHVVAHGSLRERHQGERAALAVVVGPQDEEHVLDRHDEDQRPQDERHDPEHHLAGDGPARRSSREGFLEGIKRARADVAVDDAERAKRQHPEAGRMRGRLLDCRLRRDGAGWKPLRSFISPLHRLMEADSGPLHPPERRDIAGRPALDLPELGLDESAKDRERRVVVLELGDILDPVDRQPADADRAIPAAVIAGQAMDRPVGQFPTDQPEPEINPGLRLDQSLHGSRWVWAPLGAEDTRGAEVPPRGRPSAGWPPRSATGGSGARVPDFASATSWLSKQVRTGQPAPQGRQ